MAAPTSLAEALFAIQEAGVKLVKDSQNDHFKNTYVSLDRVLEETLPILRENKVLLVQAPDRHPVTGQPTLRVSLTFMPTGETTEFQAPLELTKPGPQEVGSAITYMRRYTLLSILGIVATDDDDAEASYSRSTPKVSVKMEGKVARDTVRRKRDQQTSPTVV